MRTSFPYWRLERLQLLFDEGAFEEHDAQLRSSDPLKFVDSKPYGQRLTEMERATKMPDAVIAGSGTLRWTPSADLRART